VGLLTRGLERFETEVAALLAAGLKSTPWQQLDVTATPVGNEWQACHVLGNPFFRYFRTAPSQSRLAILETLRGGRPARYRLDEAAFARLTAAGVGLRVKAWLRRLPGGPEWDAAAFAAQLDARPRLGEDTRAAILEAAALGFLGLGAQPPVPEWGAMLADAREFIRSNPWIVTLPGLAILVTVVSINLMGDGLRDALDPKMQRS